MMEQTLDELIAAERERLLTLSTPDRIVRVVELAWQLRVPMSYRTIGDAIDRHFITVKRYAEELVESGRLERDENEDTAFLRPKGWRDE